MKNKLIIVAVLIVGIGISGVAIAQHQSASALACSKPTAGSQSYQVMIRDNKVDNPDIKAKLCDSITFTNRDNVAREIAFGPHENHEPYDGVAEKVLNQGQSFTITLDQTGSFHWHDHIHDAVEGYFTVNK